ncbi:hypothetical protein LEQ04_10270 [Riemerella anatipestifer]|nr:hypothetical protein LEQ04_10270 [Riemerella anatipestifer]
MRKILGVGVSSKYIDTLNYKILGKISYSPELNLTDQPSYEKLGIKNTYIVSDTNSKILVKEFEKNTVKFCWINAIWRPKLLKSTPVIH